MKNTSMLLQELVMALNHIGLNWTHIMEDHFEHQLEESQMSSGDIREYEKSISNFLIKSPNHKPFAVLPVFISNRHNLIDDT